MNKCKLCNTDTTNQYFCSRSCASSYNNTHHPKRRKKVFSRCVMCNIQILPRRKYCNEHRPKTVYEKGQTVGELRKSRSYQAHSRIRDLSRRDYVHYGLERKCFICGYDKHIEIHHIIPIEKFDDSCLVSEVNAITNLVALCPNHHWEMDNGFISQEEILSHSS